MLASAQQRLPDCAFLEADIRHSLMAGVYWHFRAYLSSPAPAHNPTINAG
ncbi:trans-aconitate 2-methyltransferase [Yersinia bercovieri ATCC 43970]|uniref:Trans-aconitate 2-methyltransferase n=1 Tax=Yersinia bercovieri ATCC 43970 TaxID=349968 RepID=A0ABM9Y048_YERBE|nr:trans-aconitate 2-methyltransferase [Yersinia bercovieri ATCC 43970]